MTINSDTLHYTVKTGRVLFTGDVRVHDPAQDLRLTADRMEVALDAKTRQARRIVATGRVQVMRGKEKATAKKGQYDLAKKEIRLTGNPILTTPSHTVKGADVVVCQPDVEFYTEGGQPDVSMPREALEGDAFRDDNENDDPDDKATEPRGTADTAAPAP